MHLLVHEARFAAIDFESAGAVRGGTDVPVQIGLATWSAGESHGGNFVSYLATNAPIQWSAQKVHGITPAHLADAPPLLTLWPEIRACLAGSVIVAHGKGTEKRFLRAFPGHGFGPWLDTLHLSRALWPDLPDHSLGALCTHHGLADRIATLVPQKSWHDAHFDAVASLVLLEHAVASYDLRDLPLDILLRPNSSAWRRTRTP